MYKQIWGENAEEVIYGGVENRDQGEDNENRCPLCNSRIDEFGYCACGGNLGVS